MKIRLNRRPGTKKQKAHQAYVRTMKWRTTRAAFLKRYPNCELCGAPSENAHHLHYETIGAEREADLLSLCRDCHRELHKRERAEKRFRARVIGFMRYRYGDGWEDYFSYDEAVERFQQWLDFYGESVEDS